jgi:hypothetical protein
MISTACKKKTY